MTQLERQIRRAQRRLWLNQWLHGVCRLVGLAAAIFAVVVLIQRLWGLPFPLSPIGIGFGGVAVLASIAWVAAKRAGAAVAAATLDEAAGLRERLSSGRFCLGADDPFARAVVADAERVSSSLSARRHIRLTMPPSFAWSVLSMIAAAMMFLVSPGLLKNAEAKKADVQTAELEQTKIAVKRRVNAVKRMAQANPALEDLQDQLDDLDREGGGKLTRPSDLRHEAIKKIDRLADAVKQKRRDGNYGVPGEIRKMLRALKVPKPSGAPTQRLARSLIRGDFKTAKEEIEALREQLATLKSEQDKELVSRISKQLDDIARQLKSLSKSDELEQKLRQAGIRKEDVARLLENLKKKDLDQLAKQLRANGMSQPQIQKLVRQLQRRQLAGSVVGKLAQSMKQGARCRNPGQMGEAIAGLSMAGEQLSELEMLEQEMNQLDSVLADLQNAKDDLDSPCLYCKGLGCRRCQGGSGMGRLGRGRGGLAQERKTSIGFKVERGKVHTGKGAIIGQFLVDGEQAKGEVSSSFAEVVTAAAHEASDRINRNRIPRQYHKAIKAYFSNVQRSIKGAKRDDPGAPKDAHAGDGSDVPPQDGVEDD